MTRNLWISGTLIGILLLGCGLLLLADVKPRVRRPHLAPVKDAGVKPEGNLNVQILSDKNIVLTADYTEFLRKRYESNYGAFLKGMNQYFPPLPVWSRNLYYNYAAANIICFFRPKISTAYQKKEGFQLKDSAGRPVEILELGYWLNPTGQSRFPDYQTGTDRLTKNADVAHFAFLTLAEPLKAGTYRLTNPFGETVTFPYDPAKNVSPLIKLNQLGYSPAASRKYAYAGAWRGDAGALPMKEFLGKEFRLLKEEDGSVVWRGKITPRIPDVLTEKGTPFTGEETVELNFSDFRSPGRYRIAIDGIGVSLPFAIGNEALGDTFFLHARGLYLKRCGFPKAKPWTNWTLGECHMTTRQGNFPPDFSTYRKSSKPRDFGFTDSEGNSVALSQFDLLKKYSPSAPILKGVHGGWHDAADYDRRPMHLDIVSDLLTAYLFCPENFTDGQLHLPESGNGIPDIVDEAVFGMEVWRKAQRPDGGVGLWIQADSHPSQVSQYDPAQDQQPYYLSAATRQSSMHYAGHAGMLAFVMKKLGRTKEMQMYFDSAKRAYDFARNPANRFQASYPGVKVGKEILNLNYQEPPDAAPDDLLKAAFNLYLLSGDKNYLNDITSRTREINRSLGNLSWQISPMKFGEFQTEGRKIPELKEIYQRYAGLIRRFGDEQLQMLENYPYRTPWYPANHPFVRNMGWGVSHPLFRARFLISAWKLTSDPKYRDGAFLANDFHNGANPQGMTMTSGLGYRFPARFLDLPSYGDGIPEFVPGITPYRMAYYIPIADVELAHGLYYQKRPDHNFPGADIALLPEKLTGGKALNRKESAEVLMKNWPVWRRFPNVEAYTVAVSEYTVWETIGPAAAVSGCLMEPGYRPSEAVKNRKPVQDITKLPGYAPLP